MSPTGFIAGVLIGVPLGAMLLGLVVYAVRQARQLTAEEQAGLVERYYPEAETMPLAETARPVIVQGRAGNGGRYT